MWILCFWTGEADNMIDHTRYIEIGEYGFDCRNGAWICKDTVMGMNCTVFPGAVLGRPPVSTNAQARKSAVQIPPLKVSENCVIGANVVLYRGISIASNCLIGDTACIRENVRIGEASIIAMGVTINYNTLIGSQVKVMDNTHLTGNMIVEDNVFIGMLVTCANDNSMGREAALNVPVELRKREGPIIRRNATIGQGTCILPGVEIGENSIIGANSVITKSIPDRVMAMGIPARVIRELKDEEIKP